MLYIYICICIWIYIYIYIYIYGRAPPPDLPFGRFGRFGRGGGIPAKVLAQKHTTTSGHFPKTVFCILNEKNLRAKFKTLSRFASRMKPSRLFSRLLICICTGQRSRSGPRWTRSSLCKLTSSGMVTFRIVSDFEKLKFHLSKCLINFLIICGRTSQLPSSSKMTGLSMITD